MFLPTGGGLQKPSRIIVHAMGEYIVSNGQAYTARDWLLNLGLSTHSLITPSGVNIRCRQDDQVAYHAKGYNVGSLGIEVLVPGVYRADKYHEFLLAITTHYVTDSAYWAAVEQCREWLKAHDISHIDRHSDLDPTRKQDPGSGFPWGIFLEDAANG